MPNSQKGFSSLILIILIVLFLGVVCLLFLQNIKDGNNIKVEPVKKASIQPQLANPASVNCSKQGGTLTIQTLPNGSQYGLCTFEDNMQCEEWALFYGNCPVGGVKVTGFDTPAQIYCAIQGGQTLAVANAQCTLPSGKVCSDETLYSGTCSAN